MKKKIQTYIVNGRRFHDYQSVVDYADANGWRIVSTEQISKHTHLITLNKVTC